MKNKTKKKKSALQSSFPVHITESFFPNALLSRLGAWQRSSLSLSFRLNDAIIDRFSNED